MVAREGQAERKRGWRRTGVKRGRTRDEAQPDEGGEKRAGGRRGIHVTVVKVLRSSALEREIGTLGTKKEPVSPISLFCLLSSSDAEGCRVFTFPSGCRTKSCSTSTKNDDSSAFHLLLPSVVSTPQCPLLRPSKSRRPTSHDRKPSLSAFSGQRRLCAAETTTNDASPSLPLSTLPPPPLSSFLPPSLPTQPNSRPSLCCDCVLVLVLVPGFDARLFFL